jgi:hypothetical protein
MSTEHLSPEHLRTVLSRHTTAPWGRAVFLGIGVGGVAVVVTTLFGRPLMGVFGCLGLALGMLNFFLLRRSVLRMADNAATATVTRKQITFSSLSRLMAITVLAIACAVLVRPDGIAVFVGLAACQLVMGARAVVPAVKELRK